ncbi:MAG: thiosulfate oxidation carrier complex protein SoxZ [Sulfuricurvum sp.]
MKAMIKVKPDKFKNGDVIKVSLMAMHPMETGSRKDKKTGELVPMNYIKDVKFEYKGAVFTQMSVWETVSTNPVLTTYLKVDGEGDIKITLADDTGKTAEVSKQIKPKG